MAVLASLVILLVLAAPVGVAHYLNHLPYAPVCPRCRGLTEEGGPGAPLERLFAALAATGKRHCRRCGWTGRMRWRLAPEPSRRNGPAR